LAHLNGDTNLDMAVSDTGVSDHVTVLLGDGAGGFAVTGDFRAGVDPGALAVGDLNGDNRADLVAASAGSSASCRIGVHCWASVAIDRIDAY
jgi:hypothetical protein